MYKILMSGFEFKLETPDEEETRLAQLKGEKSKRDLQNHPEMLSEENDKGNGDGEVERERFEAEKREQETADREAAAQIVEEINAPEKKEEKEITEELITWKDEPTEFLNQKASREIMRLAGQGWSVGKEPLLRQVFEDLSRKDGIFLKTHAVNGKKFLEVSKQIGAEKFAQDFLFKHNSETVDSDERMKSEENLVKLENTFKKLRENLMGEGLSSEVLQDISEASFASETESFVRRVHDNGFVHGYSHLGSDFMSTEKFSKGMKSLYQSIVGMRDEIKRAGKGRMIAGAGLVAAGTAVSLGAPVFFAVGGGLFARGLYAKYKGWKAGRQSIAAFTLDKERGKYNRVIGAL